MINHFRTLLLNCDGTTAPESNYPGEEYVPPGYAARRLPPHLLRARCLLFGSQPDRAAINLRLRELLAFLHAGELAEFITALDVRTTYLPFTTNWFTRFAAGTVVTPLNGTTAAIYPIISQPRAMGDRVYFCWQIDVISPAQVQIQSLADPGYVAPPVSLTYTIDAGLSAPVSLDAGVTVRFEPVVGARWLVTRLARPNRNPAAAAQRAVQSLTEPDAALLFSRQEPYRTFENLWRLHPVQAHRQGAVALALGYRIHELGS